MIKLDLFSVPLFVIDGFITEKERLSILSYIKRNPKIFKKIGNVEGVGYGNFKITHQKTTNFNFFPEGGNILEYFTRAWFRSTKQCGMCQCRYCNSNGGKFNSY